MSEEQSGKQEAVPETESGEEHVTPPQPPQAPAQWSMPEPVFQQTSGILPQGFLKQIEEAAAASAAQSADVLEIPAIPTAFPEQQNAEPVLEMAAVQTAPILDIEPQPDLSEQIVDQVPVITAVAPVKAKSNSLRIVLGVLLAFGMLILLAIFLAFVYFYFIAKPGEVNNF